MTTPFPNSPQPPHETSSYPAEAAARESEVQPAEQRRTPALVMATISVATSVVMYVIAVIWIAAAAESESSTAAIGVFLALILAVLATPPLLLALIALILHSRRRPGAQGFAIAAVSFHGVVVFLFMMLWLPGLG